MLISIYRFAATNGKKVHWCKNYSRIWVYHMPN